MAEAGRGEGRAGDLVAVGEVVLAGLGHAAGGDQPAEPGRGLDGEGVGGQVLGARGATAAARLADQEPASSPGPP